MTDAQTGRLLLKAVEEFLIHGVKYAFPVQRGKATRGMPSTYAAHPLSDQIGDNGDLPPVWPDAEGEVRRVTLEPLHKAAPKAARKDPVLHELLDNGAMSWSTKCTQKRVTRRPRPSGSECDANTTPRHGSLVNWRRGRVRDC
jgi:hypothetical protein